MVRTHFCVALSALAFCLSGALACQEANPEFELAPERAADASPAAAEPVTPDAAAPAPDAEIPDPIRTPSDISALDGGAADQALDDAIDGAVDAPMADSPPRPEVCSFVILQNPYDTANQRGAIGLENNGPGIASDVSISFEVPVGVLCNFAETGWTYEQSGTTCTYRHAGSALPPGASLIFYYGTDSASLASVSPPTVNDFVCNPAPPCVPETDAALCARLGNTCGSLAALDNCGAARTVASCGSCVSPQTCGGAGTPNVCGAATGCSFTITENTYDASQWWGTIGFKNKGPASSMNFKLTFSVPSGAHCDYVDSGFTVAQTGTTCTFTKPKSSLAAGASVRLNYSTDSAMVKAPTNAMVTDPTCK